MKTRCKLLILLFIAVSFTACHTNNLAKYDVAEAKVFFKEIVRPEASTLVIEETSTAQNSSDDKKKSSTEDVVLDILTSVSGDILNAEKREKIENAVDTKELLVSISDNLSDAIRTYLDIIEVESLEEKPDFICTIYLEQCKLLLSQKSVSVKVWSTASVTKRTTGELVWDNNETKIIPIKKDYQKKVDDKALENVLNALQLASLDPAKIRQLVNQAAGDVGLSMAETLREDVAKAHKERNENKK